MTHRAPSRVGSAARLVFFLLAVAGPAAAAAATPVIVLNQVPCQFLESEGGRNHGFRSKIAADCEAVNARTSRNRLASAKPLVLAAGTYTFRVHNVDVPYELGFWLRGTGVIDRVKLPSVSGGGIATGGFREYTVTLVPGKYIYSCPLNPTPDYPLVVK